MELQNAFIEVTADDSTLVIFEVLLEGRNQVERLHILLDGCESPLIEMELGLFGLSGVFNFINGAEPFQFFLPIRSMLGPRIESFERFYIFTSDIWS